jgi:hypothetical protein
LGTTQAGAAQTSTLQSDEHPSPETELPSSHSSPAIGEFLSLMSWSPLPQALMPRSVAGKAAMLPSMVAVLGLRPISDPRWHPLLPM